MSTPEMVNNVVVMLLFGNRDEDLVLPGLKECHRTPVDRMCLGTPPH